MRSLISVTALIFALTFPASAASPRRPGWRDADGDCQNTRTEVILRDCRHVELSANGCKVLSAVCPDPYTGAEIATDSPAQALHVDHIFPAAEARRRRSWTTAAFTAFYNDMDNLVVTRARTNQRKSDLMPDKWCPAGPVARRLTARTIRRVARSYALPLRPNEQRALRAWERGECPAGSVVLN
jgi:chorismate mutase